MTNGPICPCCGAEVDSLDYCKSFVFVNGVRHSGAWSWRLGCCGNFLMDDELDWGHEEADDESGLIPVYLADKKDGKVLLAWFDLAPQEADSGD